MVKRKGLLFILSAPSGAGKSTLSSMLLMDYPELSYSVSYTTRPARGGEIDGVHYNFISVEKFCEMRDSGNFLEYATVHNNMYATSKKLIEKELADGKNILLDIDIQGVHQLKKHIDYGVYVFIMPPSVATLKERLHIRSDTPADSLELRLKNAQYELDSASEFDYVVVNDDLQCAYRELANIYIAECERNR